VENWSKDDAVYGFVVSAVSDVYCCLSKHKAAVTKYKNRLNEKEAQLKETEHGLVRAKEETTTTLSAVEDEVSSDIVS